MASKKQVENLVIRRSDDLCKLAEMLGYRRGRGDQLICNNGAAVSSLLDFFDDNPGCMEAIVSWVLENSDLDDDDDSCEECGNELDDEGVCLNEDCENYEEPLPKG